MKDVKGTAKSLEEVLLPGPTFTIDYYQREYRWKKAQLQALIEDLRSQFSLMWDAEKEKGSSEGRHKYFLGTIVVSEKGDHRSIVDGQQRLTTLTLLLIYLNHLQEKLEEKPINKVPMLVADQERGGGYKLKLDIEEREECMKALLNNGEYSCDDATASVKNILERYAELGEILAPEEFKDGELLAFIWWVISDVILIEILTRDEGDAYMVFETMNDRGLSLTPTEMLKGYLLSQIKNPDERKDADSFIKNCMHKLDEREEAKSDFIKVWLLSQYAENIPDDDLGAELDDFTLIETQYHRWVRNNAERMNLKSSKDFYRFAKKELGHFFKLYTRLLDASVGNLTDIDPRLESVRYNADSMPPMQYHLELAAVTKDDDEETSIQKIGVVADFIDCWMNLNNWDFKHNSYLAIPRLSFSLVKDIRGRSLSELRQFLSEKLSKEENDMTNVKGSFFLPRGHSGPTHRLLARFTDWLERESGMPRAYEDYMARFSRRSYEVEHIWPNAYDSFKHEFSRRRDFKIRRDMIGGLLLLPRKVNASLGNKEYASKLECYRGQNILAQTLHPDTYKNNPGFLQAIKKHNLEFKPYPDGFTKKDLEERSELFRQLALKIWSPDRLLAKKDA